MKELLRKILPRRLISAVRMLTIMQGKHGHVNQRNGFPTNGQGEYQPWLTYPLIEYLKGFDLGEKCVFEYGAGASTLFWASRATQVESVEFDRRWFDALAPIVPANVLLHHESNGIAYANKILDAEGWFDVIVVDGAERYRSAEAALKKLAPGGMIILDNAEWYPNTADLLRTFGLIEVRFSGFSPINAFTSTSSVFLHRDFDFPTSSASRCPPVGGVSIKGGTLDDGPGSGQ